MLFKTHFLSMPKLTPTLDTCQVPIEKKHIKKLIKPKKYLPFIKNNIIK